MGLRSKRRVVQPIGDVNDVLGLWQRMQLYLGWKEVQLNHRQGLRNREHQLTQFLLWCDERGLKRPTEITLAILEQYQRHIYLLCKPNGQPLSIATQCNRLNALKAFFSWLTKRHYLLSNPAADLEMPRIGERLPKDVLSESEIAHLLNSPDIHSVTGLRDRAMLEVLYSTGIRRAELAGLTLDSIHHEQGTVMIRSGKNRKDRLVPIGEQACYWVRHYQVKSRPMLIGAVESQQLFLAKDGLGFSLEGLSDHVGRLIRDSGLRVQGSCHLIRHSMATLMLENGADIRWIQHILGHADINTTQIYTKISIKALKAVHEATHPSGGQRAESRGLSESQERPET